MPSTNFGRLQISSKREARNGRRPSGKSRNSAKRNLNGIGDGLQGRPLGLESWKRVGQRDSHASSAPKGLL